MNLFVCTLSQMNIAISQGSRNFRKRIKGHLLARLIASYSEPSGRLQLSLISNKKKINNDTYTYILPLLYPRTDVNVHQRRHCWSPVQPRARQFPSSNFTLRFSRSPLPPEAVRLLSFASNAFSLSWTSRSRCSINFNLSWYPLSFTACSWANRSSALSFACNLFSHRISSSALNSNANSLSPSSCTSFLIALTSSFLFSACRLTRSNSISSVDFCSLYSFPITSTYSLMTCVPIPPNVVDHGTVNLISPDGVKWYEGRRASAIRFRSWAFQASEGSRCSSDDMALGDDGERVKGHTAIVI
ncbi:hypothetical protein F5146DRAFT_240144 [Armillaria mellea]|nr:hypothetical protein F5146DRAFT_240144 [Armillaria mellea]